MIRPAVVGDVPKMIEMGRRFFEASGYSDVTSFHEDSMRATFERLIVADDAICLVVDKGGLVGMAAALIYPFYFNVNHRTAQEMFWWVDKEHRGVGGQLFDSLMAGVKAKGAQSVSMIALDRLDIEKVGGFYERRGFRPSERSYIRKT